MNPTVSVLMPVYNAAATLSDCLESILAQTHTDMEIVCVDDGSTDKGPESIEEAGRKDKRIKLIRGGRRGIVDALNLGLKMCSGKYVARMDADDIMHPERIENQLRYFEEWGRFDLIGAKVKMISNSGILSSGVLRYEEWTNSLVDHEDITREIFVESPLAHPTFFSRKEFYEQLGGYRDYPWAEDYDLILRAHQRGAIFGKVPKQLLFWKDSSGRLIRQDKRCGRSAMFRAKTHYFLKKKMMGEKGGIVIAGTGSSGRTVARLFTDEGVPIRCFVDNVKGPDERTVMEVKTYGFDGKVPSYFFREFKDSYFIICIGEQKGREVFVDALFGAGLLTGRDFIRFI